MEQAITTITDVPKTLEAARALLKSVESVSSDIDIPTINTIVDIASNNLRFVVETHHSMLVVPSMAVVTITDTTGSDIVIIVGKGAIVKYHSLSEKDGTAKRAVYLMQDAHLDWSDAAVGKSTKTENTVFLIGERAQARFRSVLLGIDHERYATTARMIHTASRTHSHMLTRVALLDSSAAAYRGLIRILPGAVGCDAFQKEDTLLIGEHARMDAMPILEIDNDDVRCSHGVTFGRIDDESLFYLQSRGIPLESAKQLVISGFFDQVLISMGEHGKMIHDMFERRLRGQREENSLGDAS
jgi:Fe-S cluster assembly protein SufD